MRACQTSKKRKACILKQTDFIYIDLDCNYAGIGTTEVENGVKVTHEEKKFSGTEKTRELKVKTKDDCPYCKEGEHKQSIPPPETTHTPYSQIKCKRGRKKKNCTHNYFCSNPHCYYYLVSDQRIHALFGYGEHGKYGRITDLYCQLCETKFTVRKWTLLYRLKTMSKIIFLAMNLLVLGIDVSALQEALGARRVPCGHG